MKKQSLLLACVSLVCATPASAAVFTWDAGGDGVTWEDANNWNLNALPGAADLVFSAGSGATRNVTLSSNQTIDALRFTNGDNLTHTAGTLTVGPAGPDSESSFPEFGPAGNSYTLSGTARYDQTDGGLFILGRAAPGTLGMSDSASMTSIGELWFGMDSTFTGIVGGSAVIATTSAVQLSRFASPASSLTFRDTSTLSAGFIVLSDHPTLSGNSTLRFEGSSVSTSGAGLFAREGAMLEFVSAISGVSTLNINGPIDLLDNNGGLEPQLSVDLSLYSGTGPLTLINASQTVNGIFRGLAEGALVPGSNGRTISYAGGDGFDIVLSAVPEPSASLFLLMTGAAALRRRRP